VLPRTNAVVLLVLVTNAGKTESFFNTCELNSISFVDCDLVCSNEYYRSNTTPEGIGVTLPEISFKDAGITYDESKWN
jgi:hypothetical protein